MLNRLLTVVVIIPVAIVLIALAVANRTVVPFTLDPFNPGNPALTASMPLFVLVFLALLLGLLLGSFATWLKQGRYRKAARRTATSQPEPRMQPRSDRALTGPTT